MIFLSQPFYLGIELIKLFLQRLLFSQCFVSVKFPITGINLLPVRFIADYFLIKFPELDKQGSCQIFLTGAYDDRQRQSLRDISGNFPSGLP
jgi:hypothetical protein